MTRQIAGLPTNVGFLQELAGHSAFEKALVETHFIEHYRNDLLSTSAKASGESHDAVKLGAILAAACICKKDHITSEESLCMLCACPFFHSTTLLIWPDIDICLLVGDKTLSVWYTRPPFRMHHFAKRLMEFELEKELDGSSDELLKLLITYRSDGSYFIEVITTHTDRIFFECFMLFEL